MIGFLLLFLFDITSWSDWQDWLDDQRVAQHSARLLVILLVLLGAEFMFRRVLGRVFVRAITRAAASRGDDAISIRRRADTLLATMNWGFGIFLLFLGAGLMLSELGLNVSALIAGVGVVGIALGLGAQTLVKDVLNGMFILIEDQYAVGDTVTAGGATGEVIEINPRRTVLRDGDGNVHTIPNSAVVVAINRTRSLYRIRIEVEVAFDDTQRADELLRKLLDEAASKTLPGTIVPPKVAATAVTDDGDVRFTIVADGRPDQRWPIESALRQAIQRRFADAEIPARLTRKKTPEV